MKSNVHQKIVDKKVDAVTRYFLRWLAIESREPHVDPSTPYFGAMLDVTTVVIGLPLIGIIGFVGCATLKFWVKTKVGDWFGHSKYVVVFALLAISIIVGRLILKSRLERYKHDPNARYLFDSERDARIAKRQQAAVYFFCGVVMPGLGLLITWFTDKH